MPANAWPEFVQLVAALEAGETDPLTLSEREQMLVIAGRRTAVNNGEHEFVVALDKLLRV